MTAGTPRKRRRLLVVVSVLIAVIGIPVAAVVWIDREFHQVLVITALVVVDDPPFPGPGADHGEFLGDGRFVPDGPHFDDLAAAGIDFDREPGIPVSFLLPAAQAEDGGSAHPAF